MKKLMPVILGVVVLAGVALGYMYFTGGEEAEVFEYYSPGDFFVTNVKDSNSLFKSSVVLVLNTDDEKVLEELGKMNSIIRDTIIFVLRDQSADTLKSTVLHETLRETIKEKINERLSVTYIIDVLFNDYVIQ